MRKLAPMILISTFAFAGAAFATDLDKNGQPTVSPNTQNPQGNSYSDKSPVATGTNAPMDATAKAKADADHDKTVARKKSMKTGNHTDKMDEKMDKTVPADSATMGTTYTAPAASSEGVTSGSTGAIRDNSTTGKTGR